MVVGWYGARHPLREAPDTPSRIYAVSIETGRARMITSPPRGYSVGDTTPRFSPDGRALAFVRASVFANSDIYLLRLPAGEPQRMTVGNGYTNGLDWSADGRRLVFGATRSGQPGGPSHLWSLGMSREEPEPLSVGEGGRDPSFSRTGGRLAYVRLDRKISIARIGGPMSPESERLPTSFASSTTLQWVPRFSPDGQRVAFSSYRSGGPEIWVARSDGSGARQLTFLDALLTINGAWSPDGQQIAFFSNKAGSFDVYAVQVAGGFVRRLTTDAGDEQMPSWSRDGRWVYYAALSARRTELFRVPAEGGNPTPLHTDGGGDVDESPDGRDIYFTKGVPPDPGPPGLWRMPRDGGTAALVLAHVRSGRWALMDRGICYVNEESDPPAIEFFDFATGKISPVAFPDDPPTFRGFSVSPDGRWILYVPAGLESDIMLVENFR